MTLAGAVYVTLNGVWLLSVPDPARDQVTLVLDVMVTDCPAEATGAAGLSVGDCASANSGKSKINKLVRM
jgi:hypothetical protein